MFSRLYGQETATSVLQRAALSNRLPGTYLFTGPAHTGKAFAALLLAEALNCTATNADGKPCGQCPSCAAIAKGANPDVRVAAPAGPSRILRIPQFWPRDGVKDFPPDRAMLRDLHFAPVLGKRRVFIIEDADAFNEDTANSLLKVLEEPPAYALFILTATSTGAVLPTIASRSQVVRFHRVASPIVEQVLRERHNLDDSKAAFVAAYCEGAIGEAIRLAAQPALFEARGVLLDLAADLTSGAPLIQAFKIADELRKASDSLRARMNPQAAHLVNADRRTQLETHARHYEPEAVNHALRVVLDTRRYVERNANAQIAMESLTTQLLSLPRAPAAH